MATAPPPAVAPPSGLAFRSYTQPTTAIHRFQSMSAFSRTSYDTSVKHLYRKGLETAIPLQFRNQIPRTNTHRWRKVCKRGIRSLQMGL